MAAVLGQPGADGGGIHAVAPVAHQEFGIQAELVGHLLPQRGEVAGLEHQHAVARGERIDQRRFPRARSGCRIDHNRLGGLEDLADVRQHLLAELLELGAAVVDGGVVHRAQHAVGHVGRTRDLQEMPAAGMGVQSDHVASCSSV
ncbi:hypothetical protein D3C85_1257410 [compost metagenome]